MASSSDGVPWPPDYVPQFVQYVLNWNPRKLEVMQPPRTPMDTSSRPYPPTNTATATPMDISVIRVSKRKSTYNRSTHPPAFYDKHLRTDLVLNRVVYLESLVESMVSTVTQAINDAHKRGITLPTNPGLVMPPEMIEERAVMSNVELRAEKGVAEYYKQYASEYCLPIASTLALHPSFSKWTSLLFWTTEVMNTRWAIADGALRLIPLPGLTEQADNMKQSVDPTKIHLPGPTRQADNMKQLLQSVDPEKIIVLGRLKQRDLALWEMKSLTVGDFVVMNEIEQMGRALADFKWKYCKGGKCCDHPYLATMYESLKESPGVDAEEPPWTLPATDSVDVHPPQRAIPHLAPPSLANAPSQLHPNATLQSAPPSRPATRQSSRIVSQFKKPLYSEPSLGSNSSENGQSITGSKRKREASDLLETKTHPPKSVGKNRKGKEKASEPKPSRQRSRSPRKRQEEIDDASYDQPGVRKEVNAHAFLQQSWAEAVRSENTIIVLHSGNHEIIGIRHRKRQTLYISHVIEPHSTIPAYGKIHVGVYISALLDAMDRESQDMEHEKTREKVDAHEPQTDGKAEDHDGDGKGDEDEEPHDKRSKKPKIDTTKEQKGTVKGKHTGQGRSHAAEMIVKDQATFDEATTRNVLLLYFCYGIYGSLCPATFVRVTSGVKQQEKNLTPPPPTDPRGDRLGKSMNTILKSELKPGSTGIVHIGTMEMEPSGPALEVAVKLAFSRTEKETLEREHKLYSHLQSKGVQGIPRDFGLFVDSEFDDDTEGPYALVMSFAGLSLAGRMKLASASVKASLIATLKSIHKAGVLHGDIRPSNLCVTTTGEAFIIDLSHATKPDVKPRELKELELKELYSVLGIENAKVKTLPVKAKNDETGLRRSSRIREVKAKADAEHVKAKRQR